jgi:hypothetical protein
MRPSIDSVKFRVADRSFATTKSRAFVDLACESQAIVGLAEEVK